MATHILVVDDETAIADLVEVYLKNEGFTIHKFYNASDALACVRTTRLNLAVLDVMLPDMDGIEILKRLKKDPETRNIPVIMASAKGSEFDKIKGLDLGADDYLAKPFGMMEMVSRIKAVMRRMHITQEEVTIGKGSIQIHPRQHEVLVNGEKIELTYKEYEVLKLLMLHPGIVFSREKLLDEVWGMDYDGETRTVDVHIRTLRAKLKEGGNEIDTVRGVGYRFKGDL